MDGQTDTGANGDDTVGMTNQRAIILLSQMYIPAFDEEEKEAITKAIEALTAYEPRVMTLEEVKAYKVGEPLFYECKVFYPCWVIRLKDGNDRIHFLSYIGNIFKDISEYGIRWCCWTSCPDRETREATPWE